MSTWTESVHKKYLIIVGKHQTLKRDEQTNERTCEQTSVQKERKGPFVCQEVVVRSCVYMRVLPSFSAVVTKRTLLMKAVMFKSIIQSFFLTRLDVWLQAALPPVSALSPGQQLVSTPCVGPSKGKVKTFY